MHFSRCPRGVGAYVFRDNEDAVKYILHYNNFGVISKDSELYTPCPGKGVYSFLFIG